MDRREFLRLSGIGMGLMTVPVMGRPTALFGQIQAHVLLKGLLDFKEERKRLKKEILKIEKEIQVCERKLSNSGFLEKAPREIVAEVKEKADNLSRKFARLKENLSLFEKIDD